MRQYGHLPTSFRRKTTHSCALILSIAWPWWLAVPSMDVVRGFSKIDHLLDEIHRWCHRFVPSSRIRHVSPVLDIITPARCGIARRHCYVLRDYKKPNLPNEFASAQNRLIPWIGSFGCTSVRSKRGMDHCSPCVDLVLSRL